MSLTCCTVTCYPHNMNLKSAIPTVHVSGLHQYMSCHLPAVRPHVIHITWTLNLLSLLSQHLDYVSICDVTYLMYGYIVTSFHWYMSCHVPAVRPHVAALARASCGGCCYRVRVRYIRRAHRWEPGEEITYGSVTVECVGGTLYRHIQWYPIITHTCLVITVVWCDMWCSTLTVTTGENLERR